MQNRHFRSCEPRRHAPGSLMLHSSSVGWWTQPDLLELELAGIVKKTRRPYLRTEWWWWGTIQGKRLMNHHLDKASACCQPLLACAVAALCQWLCAMDNSQAHHASMEIASREMALKVFNWLNRKMHSNVEYHIIHENKAMKEKEDSVHESVAEQDTEALLLGDVLLNGILAIGTLGHNVNSLCPEACIEQDEFVIMDEEKLEGAKYEEEKSEAKEDALATSPSEPAPAVEPAKMHSSSMKEDNFTCFVKEEILMHEVEVDDVAKIQERPLLMVEKVEKVRTTLADLFAAEALSSSDTGEKNYQKIIIVAGASTSKPTSCMEKMHQKKPTKPTPKPLKATRKLSRVMRKMLGKKIHPEQLNGRSNAEGPLTA